MLLSNPEDIKKSRELLRRAPKILEDVDNSYIIRERGYVQRGMPRFKHVEIEIGRTLGTGGFGIVSEITSFDLQPQEEVEGEQQTQEDAQQQEDEKNTTTDEYDNNSHQLRADTLDLHDHAGNDHPNLTNETDDLDIHYDVSKAREVMSKRCLRKHGKGRSTRYAIKRLHDNLSELEKARGMVDLAIEAKYLSTVWHPNIIKMRGLASGKLLDEDFFILMDKLYDTLDRRMNFWSAEVKKNSGKLGGIVGKKSEMLKELLLERLIVAYDLAAAFWYLHENRLVYRDIKPENIGFDVRGDVKVFDFGLCKSLDNKFKCSKESGMYGYKMTGRAGSLPYMSPEVAKCKTYDTKCDVYSFAILLWEILSLKPAFHNYSHSKFINEVYSGKKERPKLLKKQIKEWPPLTRLVLPEAWDDDPSTRPDMKRVGIMIRGDLNEMTTDESVQRRTIHMDNKSDRSVDQSNHNGSN